LGLALGREAVLLLLTGPRQSNGWGAALPLRPAALSMDTASHRLLGKPGPSVTVTARAMESPFLRMRSMLRLVLQLLVTPVVSLS